MTSAAIAKVNTGGARCQAMLGSTCVTNKMYCHTGVPDMHQYISKIRLGAPSRSCLVRVLLLGIPTVSRMIKMAERI